MKKNTKKNTKSRPSRHAADAESRSPSTQRVGATEGPAIRQVYKLTVIVEVVDEAGLMALSEKVGRSEPPPDEDGNQSYGVMDALEDVLISKVYYGAGDSISVRSIRLEDWTEQQAAEDARMQRWHAEHPRSVHAVKSHEAGRGASVES